ncbi:MAG: hypothetical protein K1W34_10980 [Lachnospiraceae bacterium]
MLQLKQGSLTDIFNTYSRVVLFGAGSVTNIMFEAYKELGFEKKVDYIIDNDPNKDGYIIQVNKKEIHLVSIKSFCHLHYKNYALIIMPVFFLDIVKQIDVLEPFSNVPAYTYPFLMNADSSIDYQIRHTREMKIPKMIHYCWFGENPLPDKYKKNIESWKKYCPDYDIIEWNETNYDIKKNKFMYQAYKKKRWEYVSDYARKDIIYHYGGIYFDTDVEVIKPLDDLLYNDSFMCIDDIANIATGAGFGATKQNGLIKEFRDDYDRFSFVDDSGTIIGKACGNYETPLMVKHGYRPENTFQLRDGNAIFPREVLCPISWMGLPDRYTENTLTVHKYDELLIDIYGKKNADIKRREIEELIRRAEKGRSE